MMLDISYGAHSSQKLDVHLPQCDSFPVMLYFHGGRLEAGDKSRQKIFFDYTLYLQIIQQKV